MALVVTIAAVNRTAVVKEDSIRITQLADSFTFTAELVIFDVDSDIAIVSGSHLDADKITIVDGATTYFGGYVANQDIVSLEDGSSNHMLQCQGYGILLTETLVALEEYVTTADDAIIDDLFDTYLAIIDSVTEVAQIDASMTISFEEMSLAEIMDAICVETGARWYIDNLLNLHYFADENDDCGFDLSDTPNDVTSFGYYKDTQKHIDASMIVNRVRVIGADGITPVTRNDGASQATYGIRGVIVADGRLSVTATMEDRGDAILAANKDPRVTYVVRTTHAGAVAGQEVDYTNGILGVNSTQTIREMHIYWEQGLPVYEMVLGEAFNLALRRGGYETGGRREVVIDPNIPIASRGWSHDLTFVAEDHNTVAWSAGTITTAGGVGSFAIAPGANTGDMAATTYIYLDINVSLTALRIDADAANSVGPGKILVAVAKNVVAGKYALFQVFGGQGTGVLVDTESIAVGAVDTTEIAALAVEAAKIGAQAVETGKLALLAVEAAQIGAQAVETAKIALLAVETAQLGNESVTTGKILARTIVAGDIAVNTITAGEVAAGTITTTEIAALTIVAGDIAANTITAGQIAAGTITTTEILAATIVGGDIAAVTIAAGNIIANTLTAAQIAGNTITAVEIAAGTITTNEIAAVTILAGNIAAGTITVNEMAANSVDTAQLVAGAVEAGNINVATLSAITADMGTLTAGIIQTAAAGNDRVVIDIADGVRGISAANVVQFQLDPADGIAVAGAGAVRLSATGISILLTDGYGDVRSYQFQDGDGVVWSRLGAYKNAANTVVELRTTSDDLAGYAYVRGRSNDGYVASATLEAQSAAVVSNVNVHVTAAGVSTVNILAAGALQAQAGDGYFYVSGELGVGRSPDAQVDVAAPAAAGWVLQTSFDNSGNCWRMWRAGLYSATITQIAGTQFTIANNASYITAAWAFDGGDTHPALKLVLNAWDGDFCFDIAPANPAGAPVWNTEVIIKSDGDVMIGGNAPNAQLHIDQPSASGAQSVLLLDQGDVSEQHVVYTMGGADVDFPAIIELTVTGTPTLGWDESEDQFIFNKGLILDGDLEFQGAQAIFANPAGTLTIQTAGQLTDFGGKISTSSIADSGEWRFRHAGARADEVATHRVFVEVNGTQYDLLAVLT